MSPARLVWVPLAAAALASLGCSTSTDARPATASDPVAATTAVAPAVASSSAAPAPAPPAAPAAPKLGPETRDFDQENLALDLDLDMEHGSLTGTATHTMTALADLSRVQMHLADMTVTSITSDGGAACTSTQLGDVLTIGLDHPRKKGERFHLAVQYGGTPKSGLWFFRPTPEHPEVPLQAWSQGEGEENRHWIPCYDLPDDRLTTSMRVVVPAGLQTLSNGRPTGTETLADGRVAHTWVMDRPHVTYLITLVVGTFDDVKRDAAGVEQHDLVPPGWGPMCDEVFGRTADMMGFYQQYTGQPFAWGRYSQATVWDFSWGGMENTGATTLNMRALHKEGVRPDYSADGLVAHELAHDWFGDLITCRTFNHIWLNEGFATYFTDLWIEHHEGPDAFAVQMLGEQEGYMNGVDLKKTSETPRPAKPTDCGDMDGHQYVKGASTLHMLRKLLGDDVFQRAIQRYVHENHDQSVESEALRAALEKESGKDLKWFFDQWVYGSGFPELTVSWSLGGDWASPQVWLLVEQTQPVSANMPLFRIPFEVSTPAGGLKHFELTRAAQVFDVGGATWIEADGKRLITALGDFEFDPQHWLLARVHEVARPAEWTQRLQSGGSVGPVMGGNRFPPVASVVSRMLSARALAAFGPESVEALAKAASSDPNYSVRAEACAALGKIKDSAEAAAALCATAEDKDSRVRRAAVTAMGEHKALFVADTLKKHLADDASVYVAADAAAALGKTKAPTAFDALVKGLERESHRDQIRQRIMDGLKDLGDPRGAEIARRYLDYSWGKGIQHQLRHAAFDAMVALAPDAPETREWVTKLLGDPYFRMKEWACEATAKLKMKDALPAVDALAADGIGPGVKESAKSAAEKLRETDKPAN